MTTHDVEFIMCCYAYQLIETSCPASIPEKVETLQKFMEAAGAYSEMGLLKSVFSPHSPENLFAEVRKGYMSSDNPPAWFAALPDGTGSTRKE